MKKVFSVAIAATLLLAPFIVFGQEQAPPTKFKEGDFWQFKAREWDAIGKSSKLFDGLWEISASQGKVKVLYLTGDKKEEVDLAQVSAQGAWLFALIGRSKFYPDLKFPFSVGDKWNWDYKAPIYGTNKILSRSVEVRVTGIEQVATPAGTFRTFKLEKDDRSGPRNVYVTTIFYSPETKSVVKSLLDASVGGGAGAKREIELIKFGSAP